MTGSDFKEWRKRLGITQRQVRERWGTCTNTITKWEKEKVPLPGFVPDAIRGWAIELGLFPVNRR